MLRLLSKRVGIKSLEKAKNVNRLLSCCFHELKAPQKRHARQHNLHLITTIQHNCTLQRLRNCHLQSLLSNWFCQRKWFCETVNVDLLWDMRFSPQHATCATYIKRKKNIIYVVFCAALPKRAFIYLRRLPFFFNHFLAHATKKKKTLKICSSTDTKNKGNESYAPRRLGEAC